MLDDELDFKKDCPNYNYIPTILPKVDRIIVIGDIHGDYKFAISCLKVAKVIDDSLNWIGGNTVVVQVGDQIDRCRPKLLKCSDKRATKNDEGSDVIILKYFTNLDKQARKNGGAVYSLFGNHEIMNATGNLNYVSYEGINEFKNYVDPNNPDLKFVSGKEARIHAFAPGHEYGKYLACTRVSSLIIGSFLFVHAGFVPEFMNNLNIKNREDLIKINRQVRKWLLGLIDKKNVDKIVGSFNYSMFWDRILGNIPPNMNNKDPKCIKYLDKALEIYNVGYMIIGHTPQYFSNKLGINKTCGNKLWRIDIGGSQAFDYFDENLISEGKIVELRKTQILEILNDEEINILK
ncbi:Calcineurin-like phosphoesterase [uncultured virus]|nr:Calcineurin-like phosphoesterase [uncultured virus]